MACVRMGTPLPRVRTSSPDMGTCDDLSPVCELSPGMGTCDGILHSRQVRNSNVHQPGKRIACLAKQAGAPAGPRESMGNRRERPRRRPRDSPRKYLQEATKVESLGAGYEKESEESPQGYLENSGASPRGGYLEKSGAHPRGGVLREIRGKSPRGDT